jgi:hypothetical protein
MARNLPEKAIQVAVLEAWGAHPQLRLVRVNTGVGWFARGEPARKTDPGAYPVRFNPQGTADVVGLIAPTGRLLMIECKSATGRQSPEQATMERIVTRFGGLYVLARSVADVDSAFAALGITR